MKGGKVADLKYCVALVVSQFPTKFYEADPIGPGRYSPPYVVRQEKEVLVGKPDQARISTSLIERQILTIRMFIRCFSRLTNAFSKKVENHKAAVALHFAHYNFVWLHRTIRCTPGVAAGVTKHLWSMEELVERVTAALGWQMQVLNDAVIINLSPSQKGIVKDRDPEKVIDQIILKVEDAAAAQRRAYPTNDRSDCGGDLEMMDRGCPGANYSLSHPSLGTTV